MTNKEIKKLREEIISETIEKIKEELTIRDVADEVISGMRDNKRNKHLKQGIYAAHLKIENLENSLNKNRAEFQKVIKILIDKNLLTDNDLKSQESEKKGKEGVK